MPEIFVTRLGNLTDDGRAALESAGVVVVEVHDPTQYQFVQPGPPSIPGDDMMWAALDALKLGSEQYQNLQRARFVNNLAKVADEARARRKAAPGHVGSD